MKYPRNHGPRQKAKNRRENKPEPEQFAFTTVRKKIHGQWFSVKVYPPRWAQGDKREEERLGFKDPNRFARERGESLEKKATRRTDP